MRIPSFWNARRAPLQATDRLSRLKRVLNAALGTPYYPPFLSSVGLGFPEALVSLECVENTLDKLPSIDLDNFRRFSSDFENPNAKTAAPQEFQCPIEGSPKIAVLTGGFGQSAMVKVFETDLISKVKRYMPDVIAAPLSVLRRLAIDIDEGRAAIPPVNNALIVFSGMLEGEMTGHDRDLFWRVFRVPLFEQFLGCDGRVIASECEAHNGLHIITGNVAFENTDRRFESELLLTSLTDLRHPTLRLGTRFASPIARDPCECGKSEFRLTELRDMHAPQQTKAAAG